LLDSQRVRSWFNEQRAKVTPERLERLKSQAKQRRILILLLVLVGSVGIGLLFWWANGDTKSERINVITGLAQVIGGSALIGGLYFTAQNVKNSAKAVEVSAETLKVSQQTLANSQQSLALERRSNESERFFKAIEMLSNDNSMFARVGALYALGSLAKESEVDRDQTYDVIVSFLRAKTFGTVQADGSAPQPDVQAAIDVLADRSPDHKTGVQRSLDLSGLTLLNVNFRRGSFRRCRFFGSVLRGSDFSGCVLSEAHFNGADCRRVSFGHAVLSQAIFFNADLEGASFYYAQAVDNAVEEDWRLDGAQFFGANVKDTSFFFANLTKTHGLTQERIDTASIDSNTILPPNLVNKNSTTI
jgi:uncharacterized protein YjbI with pentapeptide repeats